MRVAHEEAVQLQVAAYLRLKWPQVMFRTDFAAGIKMTMPQAVKHKKMQSGRGWPDIFIAVPNHGKHGLFLELKEPRNTVYLKDGRLSTERHVQEQAEILQALKWLGYEANFAVGFEDAVHQIEQYLS